MKKLIIAVVVMTMFAAGTAIAQGRDYRQDGQGVAGEQRGPGGGRGPGRHHGPPQESIDACADLEEGEACSFIIPQRDLEGTCMALRNSDEVACVPQDHMRGGTSQDQ